MKIARAAIAALAVLSVALVGSAQHGEAHRTGYWHYDSQYVGTQWCTFLTSPTGNSTLLWCYDTFGSAKKAAL